MKKFLVILISCLFYTCTVLPALANSEPPGVNLDILGYEEVESRHNLIDFPHPVDPKAPQFSTIIEGKDRPGIEKTYQIYDWDLENHICHGFIPKPEDQPGDFASLIGLTTVAGENILVPNSGYDIGGGYQVIILYADPTSVTLKYTREDNVVYGYTVYLKNFVLDPDILNLYNQLNEAGRIELPALCAGNKLGSATGSPLLVAVRDTGQFLDPRGEQDWWHQSAASLNNLCLLTSMTTLEIDLVSETSTSFFNLDVDFIEESSEKLPTEPIEEEEEEENENNDITLHQGRGKTLQSLFVWESNEEGNGSGSINYSKIDFPDVSYLAKVFSSALRNFLPEKIKPKFSGANKSKVKTIIIPFKGEGLNQLDLDNQTECEQAPEHEQFLPDSWKKIALNNPALEGPLLPEKNLLQKEAYGDYSFGLKEAPYSCSRNSGKGANAVAMAAPAPENIKPEFFLEKVFSFIKKIIEGNLIHRTAKTKVKVVYSANIPGGKTAAKSAQKIGSNTLPQKTVDDLEFKGSSYLASGLAHGNLNFKSQSKPIQEQVIHKKLGTMRNNDCFILCASSPEKRVKENPSSILGNICPSCNPDDYKAPPGPFPEYCQNGDEYGCDYYDPNATQGCGPGQDPFCEGGRCNPLEIGQRKDYESHGCPVPFQGRCNDVCVKKSFTRNPAGGYGPCSYRNATVCIRKDQAEIGSCAAICNWACCN